MLMKVATHNDCMTAKASQRVAMQSTITIKLIWRIKASKHVTNVSQLRAICVQAFQWTRPKSNSRQLSLSLSPHSWKLLSRAQKNNTGTFESALFHYILSHSHTIIPHRTVSHSSSFIPSILQNKL